MKRLTAITAISLFVSFSLQAQIVLTGTSRNVFTTSGPTPTIVAIANPIPGEWGSSLTVTSTGIGHGMIILINTRASSLQTAVSLGSQSATKVGSCSPVGGDQSAEVCAWYVASTTGGQTTVTADAWWLSAIAYEVSWPGSTSIAYDTSATCSGTTTTYCTASIMTSLAKELVVSAYSCQASGTSITGTGTTYVLTPDDNGQIYAEGTAVASGTVTSTVNLTCANSANTSVGGLWSFHN
jgi:hypothetical protein